MTKGWCRLTGTSIPLFHERCLTDRLAHCLLTFYDPHSTDRLWPTLLTVYDPLSTDRVWPTLYWPSMIHTLLTFYDPHSTDRLWPTVYWLSITTLYSCLWKYYACRMNASIPVTPHTWTFHFRLLHSLLTDVSLLRLDHEELSTVSGRCSWESVLRLCRSIRRSHKSSRSSLFVVRYYLAPLQRSFYKLLVIHLPTSNSRRSLRPSAYQSKSVTL